MWHYQIIKFPTHYELVEKVTFNNKSDGYTDALLVGESVEDIEQQLAMMSNDIKHYPVLTAKQAHLDE